MSNYAAMVKDEKKMRKLIVEGFSEKDRAGLWKSCIEYRTGYPITGPPHPPHLPLPLHYPLLTSPCRV